MGFDSSGAVLSVVHDSRPGWSYLTTAGTPAVSVGGAPLEWSEPELAIDADELEVSRYAGSLQVVIRHSFAVGWGIRVAVTNRSEKPLALDGVRLDWTPAPDASAWALAAGAVGSYAVLPPDAVGPLLGGTLGLGTLVSVTAAGLEAGTVVLTPGGRYVVQWQWAWFPHPRAFAQRPGRRGDRQVPRSLQLMQGEPAVISTDEDEALVLPPGLVAEPVRDQVELTAAAPGHYRVELRSARGTTSYRLTWADPVEQLLVGAADQILAGPRTPAGIVRLTGVDEALIVQFALRGGLAEIEAAEEALDLFGARLESGADPLVASFWCGEFDRTGDDTTLEVATELVLGIASTEPGLGLAASQLALARVVAGLPLRPLTEHLARVATGPTPGGIAGPSARLELALLVSTLRAEADLLAVAARLGGGLKGHPVRPLPLRRAAYLAAVLAAVSDEVSSGARSRLACTAHELGRWTEAAVIARLGGAPVGPAHGWLAVAARTR